MAKMAGKMETGFSQLLKRYRKVIQEWPVDTSRKGRDLGEYLRNSYMIDQYKDLIHTDPAKANVMVDCLEKLNSDYYYKLYPRLVNHGFSGNINDQQTHDVNKMSLFKRMFMRK